MNKKVWVVVAQDYDYIPGVRVFDNESEANRFAAASNHPGQNVFSADVERDFPEVYYTTFRLEWKPFATFAGSRADHFFKPWVANHKALPGEVPCPEDGILASKYEEIINKSQFYTSDYSEVKVTSTISLNHAAEVATRIIKEKTGKDVTPPAHLLPKEAQPNAS